MILVIPSIELEDGESVSSIKIEDSNSEFYSALSKDPMELSMLWRRENAKCLHIIDNDSFAGNNNFMNMNSILYLLHSVDIPIQYASDFESADECRILLENGVYRLVLGSLAVDDPDGVAKLIEDYTASRIAFQANVDNGFIFFRKSLQQMRDKDFAEHIKKIGGNRIVYRNENCNNGMNNQDIENLKTFATDANVRITIQDGICNSDDLLKISNLNTQNIDSCIIGTPLYSNKFPCQSIWRMAEIEQHGILPSL